MDLLINGVGKIALNSRRIETTSEFLQTNNYLLIISPKIKTVKGIADRFRSENFKL